jgi:DNA-binding MarR family transcriptional regulator
MNEHATKEDILNILRLLSSNDYLTQSDLSNHLNISLGKANYLVKSLAKKGFIKIMNFTEKGNRSKYLLTEKGLKEKTLIACYLLKKKERECLELKQETENKAV